MPKLYRVWYNNRKAVIIFQVAFASPPLALPAVATGEIANYTIPLALYGIITTKPLLKSFFFYELCNQAVGKSGKGNFKSD